MDPRTKGSWRRIAKAIRFTADVKSRWPDVNDETTVERSMTTDVHFDDVSMARWPWDAKGNFTPDGARFWGYSQAKNTLYVWQMPVGKRNGPTH